MMTPKAVKLRVIGEVQGVYYRQTCRSVARSLGLVGSVRNMADGSVEIRAQGDSDAIDRLLDWAWVGPAGSSVRGVESESMPFDNTLADFLIQPGPGH